MFSSYIHVCVLLHEVCVNVDVRMCVFVYCIYLYYKSLWVSCTCVYPLFSVMLCACGSEWPLAIGTFSKVTILLLPSTNCFLINKQNGMCKISVQPVHQPSTADQNKSGAFRHYHFFLLHATTTPQPTDTWILGQHVNTLVSFISSAATPLSRMQL